MPKMKGIAIADIVSTALVLAVAVILVSVMFLVNIVTSFTSDPQGFQIVFEQRLGEPFNILEGLSHLKYRDRQVSEHLLEAVITGSIESGSSQGADAAITDFIGAYKKPIYIITLSAAERKILERTSIRGTTLESISCGENAFCTEKSTPARRSDAGDCMVGRVKIDDAGKCSQAPQICCKLDLEAYSSLAADEVYSSIQGFKTKYAIVNCGKGKAGICNPRSRNTPSGQVPLLYKDYCGNGFELIEDNGDCEDANNGATPICCALAASSALEKSGEVLRAEAPLLYKGRTLFEQKEYSCQDSRNEKCGGEYVSGLCDGPDYVQCCVTDEIRCKPTDDKAAEDKYFCRDNSHCPGGGENTIDDVCPDPGQTTARSAYQCCKAEEPYKEDSTGKAEPKNSWGSCYLTLRAGIHYNTKPVEGKLEVSTG